MEEKRMIEGRRPVMEALRAGSKITRILLQKGTHGGPLTEILALAQTKEIPVEYWDKQALDKKAVTRNHQGILAETPPFAYTPFEQLLVKKNDEHPFLVILDHLQDPHNLGALIRTAYAAGCDGLVIPERRAAQMTPAAVRTAAGAAEYLPVARVVNIARCLEECKQAGLWLYGADMDGKSLYTKGDYQGPMALVIGSEGAGLSRLTKEKCDFLVRLPMQGAVASLNASVAGALLLYEVYRQRQGF
ncbi:MAG TPA: 23S rRNA (guanosine(2251)-2'-O)-methyltransferase RlmB [Oscillospiraceae bacterium]|nr:23S rRNA (guanosine(2251)-2'-O)-methyltransferase RlmB [Oscillospiraceae bacterium]